MKFAIIWESLLSDITQIPYIKFVCNFYLYTWFCTKKMDMRHQKNLNDPKTPAEMKF